MTICQVMALRAARNAGLRVPNETIDRCVDYVKRSQNADGGFRYMLTGGGKRSFPVRRPAWSRCTARAIYEGPEIERGLSYLDQFLPRENAGAARTPISSTASTTACRRCGRPAASGGSAGIRPSATCSSPGSRPTAPGRIRSAAEYGTAMATIVLQMPDQQRADFPAMRPTS